MGAYSREGRIRGRSLYITRTVEIQALVFIKVFIIVWGGGLFEGGGLISNLKFFWRIFLENIVLYEEQGPQARILCQMI